MNGRRPEAPAPARGALLAALGFAVPAVLAIRWAPVLAVSDLGCTHEASVRVYLGQHHYADFVTTFPPLTAHTTALAMSLLGTTSILPWAVDLWAWWFAALAAGWLLAREMGTPPGARALLVAAAGACSVPAWGLVNSYNCASTALAGLSFALLLRARRADGARGGLALCTAAGIAAGLAFWGKQNVGAAAATALLAGVWLPGLRGPRRGEGPATTAGLAAGLGIPFLLLAAHAGAEEVLRQALLDAGTGKGGPLTLLARCVPRIPLPDLEVGAAARRALEGLSTLLLVGVPAAWLVHRHRARAGAPAPAADDVAFLRATGISLAVVAVVALACIPGLRQPPSLDLPRALPSTSMAWSFTLHGACLVALAAGFLHAARSGGPLGAAYLGAAAVAAGHTASSMSYSLFALPVALPAAAHAAHRVAGFRRPALLATLLVAASVVVHTWGGRSARVNVPLTRLPAPFAGFFGQPSLSAEMAILADRVAPRVRGRRTAWISSSGLQSIWGGIPVFAPATWYHDSYPARLEPRILAAWEREPPDVIVVAPHAAPAMGGLFERGPLEARLRAAGYRPAEVVAELDLAVWERSP